MDKTQIKVFVDFMIGWRALGAAGDEAITEPYSPELRAFIVARLGDGMPLGAFAAVGGKDAAVIAKPLADLLREVADGLSPQDARGAAPDLIEALLFFANPPTTSEYAWKQAKEKARAALAKAGVA